MKIAAAFINDRGELLPYSIESTQNQVYNKMSELLAGGQNTLEKLLENGAKIVSIEISIMEGTEATPERIEMFRNHFNNIHHH